MAHFHGPVGGGARGGAGRPSASAKQAIETLVYRRADRCIVLSQAFQRILIRRYGIREERVHVVPGGVDILRFNRRETRGEVAKPFVGHWIAQSYSPSDVLDTVWGWEL